MIITSNKIIVAINRMAKNRVAKAGMGYIIGNLLIKGIAFLSTPIFTRLLPPEGFGVVSAYLAYETYLTVVVGFLFNSSIKNAKYELDDGFQQYVSDVVLLVWLHSLVAIIVASIFANKICVNTGFPFYVIVLLILNAAGTALIYIYNSYVSINYEYKRYILISGANAVSNIVISILLMETVFASDRPTGRILGYGIPVVVILCVLTCVFWREKRPGLTKKNVLYAYKFSLPLLPSGISEVTLGQYSRLVIQSLVGSRELGIYSLSYSVYAVIGIVRLSLDNVWGPWFFERASKQEYGEVKKRAVQYSIAIAIFSLAIMLLSPEIVYVMGDRAYFEARYSVVPLAAASFFVFASSMPMQAEYYLKKQYLVSIGMVASALINIALTYILVKNYGYVYAAYSTLSCYALMSLFHYCAVWNAMRIDIFSIKKQLLISAVVIVAVPIVEAIMDLAIVRYILLCMIVVASVLTFKKLSQGVKKGEE